MKWIAILIAVTVLAVSQADAGEALHGKLLAGTEGALIKAGGAKADASAIKQKKYLFIYFSAHWCPPCRKFTPMLVEFYNAHKAKGDFELLFVSSDKDQAAMNGYMTETKMPWLGLSLSCKRGEALGGQFGVTGIPCLVLLDDKDNVLASSFKGKDYQGPQVALEKYEALHKK